MNKLIIFLLALALAACTSISVTSPTPIVEVPELHGAEGISVGFGARLHTGHEYTSSENANSRPPNLTEPNGKGTITALGGAHLNLLKRLKLGVSLEPFGVGGFVTAQIQLLGDGRVDGKQGNFSLSVFGHSGRNNGSGGGDQSTSFGPGGQDWSAKVKNEWYDYGLSIGYRSSDTTIVYIGAARQLGWYSTTIGQTVGSPPLGTYTATDHAEGIKGALGASFTSERGEFFVAIDYTEYKYNLADAEYITGGLLGFTFR